MEKGKYIKSSIDREYIMKTLVVLNTLKREKEEQIEDYHIFFKEQGEENPYSYLFWEIVYLIDYLKGIAEIE